MFADHRRLEDDGIAVTQERHFALEEIAKNIGLVGKADLGEREWNALLKEGHGRDFRKRAGHREGAEKAFMLRCWRSRPAKGEDPPARSNRSRASLQ